MNANIFSTLFKYCVGSDENYLTDAFSYLLRLLLERAPNEGVTLINQLCGLNHPMCFGQASVISISTQVTVEEGRPDIEVKDHHILVYIEVKHDAPLSVGQLEYYKKKLTESPHDFTQLVLLTRSRISATETTLSYDDYHHIRWYEVHDRLCSAPIQDEVCSFFIQSFLDFLKEKNMSMNKVTWEYLQGVPALVNFTNILEEALVEVMPSTKIKRTSGWSWRGFYTPSGFFIGIRLELPNILSFENNLGGSSITYKRDLDLDEAHFFSLKQGEQFECLIHFLKKAIEDAPTSNKNVNLDKVVQEDAVQE